MKERILELAKDHLLQDKYGADGQVIEGEYYEFDPEELKKFAELIVRECANRATWAQDISAKDIGGEVLKHFGVEE
jgi:hypothetical protein